MSIDFTVHKNHKELSFEEDLEKRSNKNIFFAYLKEDQEKEKYDLATVLKNKKDFIQVGKVNLFFRRMRQLFDLTMVDMLVFLDEEEFKLEEVNQILNYENSDLIRKEIGNKFRVKKMLNTDANEDFIE